MGGNVFSSGFGFQYVSILLVFSFMECFVKRSDMIQIIASELIDPDLGMPNWSIAQEIAEAILKRIETEGMLPPKQKNHGGVAFFETETGGLTLGPKTEWEKE
jgi:hypothetical protein